YSQCKNSLTNSGIYLSAVIGFPFLMQIIWTSMFSGKKAKTSSTGMLPVKDRLNYLLEIKELMKTGKIKTVIDQQYHLSQMVQAHQYVEKGHKKGSVIITV